MPAPSQPSGPGFVTIADLPERGRLTTGGFVEFVRYTPAAGAPRFQASLVDRPAAPGGRRAAAPRIELLWHGRSRVPGIVPGAWVRVRGAVSTVRGVPTMYDPHYEILASHRELAGTERSA
ncbi:hypothetical protein [Zhihengliuella sp.]|uniref:hypothetical protein n=1 Tax=Zhihengliuella sp. TaxID=1954483 RepID=UPI002810EA26|nr:hypothetical protein [Zhihengliuella sp.]